MTCRILRLLKRQDDKGDLQTRVETWSARKVFHRWVVGPLGAHTLGLPFGSGYHVKRKERYVVKSMCLNYTEEIDIYRVNVVNTNIAISLITIYVFVWCEKENRKREDRKKECG